jgi:ribulose-phosphate 3-epimerase
MSVEPGFGGQGFIPSTLEKISSIDKTLKEKNLRDQIAIQVDGGIKLHNAKEVIDAGADILVAGSEVFKSENPSETIDEMYNL